MRESISREEIVRVIKDLTKNHGRNWLTFKQFLEESQITRKQFFKHFPKWNQAVEAAGLEVLDRKGRPDQKKGYTREELLNKARRLADKLGRDFLSESEFTKATRISYRPIHRLFGSWNEFLAQAKLSPHPLQKQRIPDERLFQDYIRVWQDLGRCHPAYTEFASKASFSINTYTGKRFNGFKGFRRSAVLYGISKGVMSPNIIETLPDDTEESSDGEVPVYDPLNDRPVLGEKIEFRGLQHAPVNEMGVVFLFGVAAHDLGFIVESVQAGFPDCEAKRRLKNNRWQQVRIEFEYMSSNFLRHKHDQNSCDLIVCWIHDWKDCPIEVLCLKEVVEKNSKSKSVK